MQCEARSKQSGTRCMRHAAPGRRVCASHGGKTPRGVASPHFKHGRYSRSLPERLAAWFEEADADPDLLSLRDDIALMDATIDDLLMSLNGVPPSRERVIWREVRKAIEAKRRLVESEVIYWTQRRRVLTREEAETLVAALAASVNDHVQDPRVRAAIAADIERLTTQGHRE